MDFQLTLSYEEDSVGPSVLCSLLGACYPSQAVSPRVTAWGGGKVIDLPLADQAPALPRTVTLQVS